MRTAVVLRAEQLSMERPPLLKAVFLLLALTGCQTDGQRAWNACEPIADHRAWGECFDQHMVHTAPQRQQQENEELTLVPLLLNRPAHTTCMNIGGIVTCNSR
jgi:hypothetical protein